MSRSMKDSCVEWIGEIPEHWRVVKTKKMFKIVPGGTPSTNNPLYWNDGDIAWATPKDMNNLVNGELEITEKKITLEGLNNSSAQIIPKNSIILSSRAPVGKIAKNVIHMATNQGCKSLVDVHDKANTNFYYYLFIIATEPLTVISTGTTFVELSGESLKNFTIIEPERDEQQKVAAFLDDKISQIDSIIDNTKQSITELKKYKYALITEAVTKGLNPDAKMKDSGIEWIGEIPDHWGVNKLNQYFYQVKNKNIGLIENNLLSLSYGNIVKRSIHSNEGLLPDNFEGYNIIRSGDIVLRMTDLQNDHTSLRVGMAKEAGIITSAYITIRKYNETDENYTYYFLHSFDICKGFYGLGSGVRQGVTYDTLKKLEILLPPLNEQKQIVAYLDEKIAHIDALIADKEKMVQELEDYKKSLIYEYVTGKKEV